MFFYTYLTDLIKNRDVVAALQRIKDQQEINSRTYWGQYTPLHLAIETNQPEIIDALLIANANVNAVTYHDWLTPLHIAANAQDLDSICKLIKYKPNLNAKTYNDQDTALHIVVRLGLLEHAKELLKAGAGVDIQNKNKDTALHIAARQGNNQLVELLLSYGASCNIHNHNEQTPLFIALMADHEKCANLLLQNGAGFGNSFNSLKKLQLNYENECKKNNILTQENAKLHNKLEIAKDKITELTKKIETLQAIMASIPVADEVEEVDYSSCRPR